MMNYDQRIFKAQVTADQCKDTGMAITLIFLLLVPLTKQYDLIYWAIGVQVLNMVKPQIYRPAAIVWYKLAELLGAVVSRIILSIVFLVVVTPVGLLRRALGKDSLKLKLFKKGHGSVMETRNHTFSADDIRKPY
jgi:hypothetical protein